MTTTVDPVDPVDPVEPSEPFDLGGPWPDLTDVEPADGRVLAVAAVAALGTDLAMRSGVMGLAGALLVAVVAGGVLGSGRAINRRAWPVLAGAPLFGIWLAARSSGWLLALDVLAAAGLLVLGATLARAGDPFDLTIPGLLGRAVHAIAHGILGVAFLFGVLRRRSSDGRSFAVLRGVLLGAPLVLVIGVLLGSADPVFASFFGVPDDVGDLLGHVVLLGIGAWGAAGLLRLASGEAYDVRPSSPRPLGSVEAMTVLGGLVAVFAAFSVSQLVAVIGGADYVRRTAGLSYGEYARNGFFQLLAVAAITLGVLLAVRATVADFTSRRFVVLSEVAVALTLVVVGGAVRRLWLYEAAYGLTALRLCSVLFALWIGAVFVLLGVSLSGAVRSSRAWFVPVSVALFLAGLLIVNGANPEALIVSRNVGRFAGSDRLDVDHLLELSDDAVPELLRSMPSMTPDQATRVRDAVCGGERRATGGLWAFNASRDAAIEARNQACPRVEA
jgi:hypothetical protein